MSKLSAMIDCAGAWQGTNRLYDPNTNAQDDTASTAIITPVLQGRFVRMDYIWSYQGAPQEGSFLIGHESEADAITLHWIDSWHMSDKVMSCRGEVNAAGEITVLGYWSIADSPDWGWRTHIQPQAGQTLKFQMFVITPDGEEAPAVETSYTPRTG